jgi:hypothetical protein
MPFAFAIVGLVLVIAGVRGKSGDLLDLVKVDLTGPNNFVYWILAMLILGGLGYIDDFRDLSRALLVLVLLVLVLREDQQGSGGFFVEFQSAVKSITRQAA